MLIFLTINFFLLNKALPFIILRQILNLSKLCLKSFHVHFIEYLHQNMKYWKGYEIFFFLKRKSFHRWNCLSHLRLSESFPRFWFTRFTPFLSGKASSKQATKNWENWRGLSTHVPLGTDTNSKAKRPGSLSAAKNITPDSVCLNISSSWV